MKRLTIFLLMAATVFAGDVVFFDPVSVPVTNRVTRFALSLNPAAYRDATNMLWITNRAEQITAGVTQSNITSVCVVDGQTVRLFSQAETDRIAATNALNAAQALLDAKYEAREYATNVVNGTGGQELFIRSLGETCWFLINYTRTNDGKVGITKAAFGAMIQTNIANFGQ